MDKIKIHPTDTAQWCDLIADAKKMSSVSLTEELESYLVFLLMRFTKSPELSDKVLALDFLEHQKDKSKFSQDKLRDVGDSCLLFSGLFPGIAQRRQLRISYYVNMGRTAYLSLSENTNSNSVAGLFYNLGGNFIPLMETLHGVREINSQGFLDPLAAQELWDDTKSSQALKILQQTSKSGFIFSCSGKETKH